MDCDIYKEIMVVEDMYNLATSYSIPSSCLHDHELIMIKFKD